MKCEQQQDYFKTEFFGADDMTVYKKVETQSAWVPE